MVIEVDADLFAFRPDPRRARMLDATVRADFAASIGNVLRAVAEQGAIRPGAIEPIVAAVRDPGASPGLITAYAGLVEAIYGDRADEMAACLAALEAAATTLRPVALRLVTLDDGALGPGQAERYRGLFDDDPGSPLSIAPLPNEAMAHAEGLARSGLDLLDRGVPELAGEIRAILREIVFVRSDAAAPEETFQGASVFLAWGAVLLNIDEQPDRVAFAESLAHETGHSLLSGLSRGTPLVENPPDERHASPLRSDPRPLEGIVHATYVLARMHYCLARLLESGLLAADERSAATTALAERRRAFATGLAVVDARARLTDLGRAAFEPARAYMAALPA